MAPIPEATFFVTFSIWPLQSSLSSMVTPSDFAVVTWLTSKLLIANVGDSVRALSLCLDPISINSVLVIFRVTRRTSKGSEAFSLFISLNSNKSVLLSFFSLIKTIYTRVSTKPLPNDAKSPLPVDVRRSKTLLLKLPNVFPF